MSAVGAEYSTSGFVWVLLVFLQRGASDYAIRANKPHVMGKNRQKPDKTHLNPLKKTTETHQNAHKQGMIESEPDESSPPS